MRISYAAVALLRSSSRLYSNAPSWTSTPVFTTETVYSDQLGLQLISQTGAKDVNGMILQRNDAGILQLSWGGAAVCNEVPFYIDFASQTLQRRALSAESELVVKAMGRRAVSPESPQIWDLTAGLGRDSFLLASAGYTVQMFERNSVLHELLSDAIRRLSESSPNLSDAPVAVYMDPMYPSGAVGRKSSVKKDTQMLRRLVGETEGEDEINNSALFHIAMQTATKRVVVKRPLNALSISSNKPNFSVTGTGQRFDVYIIDKEKPMM